MRLENEFTVPVSVADAWRLLLDVQRIAPCLPGATVDSVDGDEVMGRVKVKVGPVSVSYAGTARFVEKDESAHRFVLEGKGRETRGAGTASATVTGELHEEGSSTRVTVTTDLDITGKPAQFGRGVMADVAGNLISQFASCLAAELTGSKPATADTHESAAPRQPAQASVGSSGAASSGAGSDALDLFGTVGVPVLKRLAPVAAAVVVMAAARLLRRGHSRSQIVVHVHVPSQPGVGS
jgi:carbon monoxide dehydrogenase subunit G